MLDCGARQPSADTRKHSPFTVTGKHSPGRLNGHRTSRRSPPCRVRDGARPQDPLLARAVDLIGRSKPLKPEAAIEKLTKNLRDELAKRIVDAGWVREEKGKVLGIFPTTRWPEVDGSHERAVRNELGAALLDGVTPTPRTAALVSLLSAVDAAPKLFPDADRRAVKKRAKDIAEGDWAGKAVRASVDAVNAAIIVAATVPAIVAGSG